jgi:uncharacterized protein
MRRPASLSPAPAVTRAVRRRSALCSKPVRELKLRGVEASAALFGTGATAVVLGHGAGGDRTTPMLVALAEALSASGRAALLYNFPYAEKGSGRPDSPAVLEATARAAAALARDESGASRIVHGGRSMGGRIASQVVAQGEPAAGLAFLAYPLHPPGRSERLRDSHLGKIGVPMLFLQGTRDAFAREDLLQRTIDRLRPRAELVRIAEADHSFRVLKRSGRTPEDVLAEVRDALLGWLERCSL